MLARRLTLFEVTPDLSKESPRIAEIQRLLSGALQSNDNGPSVRSIVDSLRDSNVHVYAIRTTQEEIIAIGVLHILHTLAGKVGVISNISVREDWEGKPKEMLVLRLLEALSKCAKEQDALEPTSHVH